MKAVVYHGPRNVSVDEVPDPKIEKPTDALVRITATNICGSDLHMYEGRTDFKEGRVFGHENVGEVIGVGDAVDKIKVGDMISAPFNVACGHCRNCEEGLTNYCLRANEPRVVPTSKRAASSAMRTSGKSSGSAMRSTRSKSAT